MRKLMLGAALYIGFAAVPTQASVKVLGEKIGSDEICPSASSNKCILDSSAATVTYVTRDRRYLNLDANLEPVVTEYLGHLYKPSLDKGTPYCGGLANDPLAAYAREKGIPYWRIAQFHDFSAKIRVKKLIDGSVGADVKAAAVQLGVPPQTLDNIDAAVAATYNKVKNRDVEIAGVFRFYEMNPDLVTTFNASDAPPALAACRKWLQDNDRELITTLTGYKLVDAKSSIDLTSGFTSELKAKLGSSVSQDQIAKLSAAFASEVERKVELKFSPTFELLTAGVGPEV